MWWRKQKTIPTILGLTLIIASIAATTYLVNNLGRFFIQATPEAVPKEVKITNVSSNSFTVSWVTDEETTGSINFGEAQTLNQNALDDRDQVSNSLGKNSSHHVTLKNLKLQTTYYFKITSGKTSYDNNGVNYQVATGPEIPAGNLEPIHGSVFKSPQETAEGTIVYLTLAGAQPISTLVKSSGEWLIPLSSARTQDLKEPLAQKGEVEELFIQGGKAGTSKALVKTGNDAPVPQIILGKNYDFSQNLAQGSPAPIVTTTAPTSSPSATSSFSSLDLPSLATPSFSLAQPATETAVAGKPFFRGKGTPGKTVTIEINSPATYSGTATIDQNGNWIYTPSQDLPPGEHTVTITSLDKNGILQKITRKFTVLAAGLSVVQSATPSATQTPTPTKRPTNTPTSTSRPSLTPTASPSAAATLTPTISPTRTPTPTPTRVPVITTPTPTPPVSGNQLLSLMFLTGGLVTIMLGLLLLKPGVKKI